MISWKAEFAAGIAARSGVAQQLGGACVWMAGPARVDCPDPGERVQLVAV